MFKKSEMPADYHKDCESCEHNPGQRLRQFRNDQLDEWASRKAEVVSSAAKKAARGVQNAYAGVREHVNAAKLDEIIDKTNNMTVQAVEGLEEASARVEDWAAEHSERGSFRLTPRQIVASGTAVAGLAAPVTPALAQEPNIYLSPQGQAVARSVAQELNAVEYNVSPDGMQFTLRADEAIQTPLEPETAEDAVIEASTLPEEPALEAAISSSVINQPLIRNLSHDHNISVLVASTLSEDDRANRQLLNERIEKIAEMNGVDLEAGEAKSMPLGFAVQMDIETEGRETYTVKKGDTAASLYEELGWKAAGYSFEEFLQANAVVDENLVMTSWEMLYADGMDAPIVEESLLSSEKGTEAAPQDIGEALESAEVTPQEVVEVEDDRTVILSEEEARVAVEQLVDIVSHIVVDTGEETTADRVAEKAEEYVEAISTGATNLAQVQGEVLQDVLYSTSGVQSVEEVASLAVRDVYRSHGLSASDTLVAAEAEKIVAGISEPETFFTQMESPDGAPFDFESETISSLDEKILASLETAQTELDQAIELVELVNPDYIELNDIQLEILRKDLAHDILGDTRGGDALYYLLDFTDLNYNEDIYNLSANIYQHYGAGALLEQFSYRLQIEEMIADDVEEFGYINASALLSSIESDLEEKILTIMPEIESIVSEIDVMFPDKLDVDNVMLTKLSSERLLGSSGDRIKMLLMEDISANHEVKLQDLLSDYFIQTYDSFGLEPSLTDEKLEELVVDSLTMWKTLDSPANFNELDISSELYAQIDSSIDTLVEGVSDYLITDLSEEYPDALISLAKDVINNPGRTAVELDIATLKVLTVAEDIELVTGLYLNDYYEREGGNEYLDSGLLEAITERVLNGADPAEYVVALSQFSGNPAELFPEGFQYVLSDYNDKDLRTFIEAAGLDVDELLANPLNANLIIQDGKVIAVEQNTIWFDDESAIDFAELKKAYDEHILGIRPPEPVKPVAEVRSSSSFESLIETGPMLESVEQFASYKWDKNGDGVPDDPLLREIWNDWSRADIAAGLIKLEDKGWINYDAGVAMVLQDIIDTGGNSLRFGNDGDDFDEDDPLEMNRNMMRMIMISAVLLPQEKLYILNLTDGGHIVKSNHHRDGKGNAVDIGTEADKEWLHHIADGLITNQELVGGYREFILTHPEFDDEMNHGKPYDYTGGTADGHGGRNLHIHLSHLNVILDDPESPTVRQVYQVETQDEIHETASSAAIKADLPEIKTATIAEVEEDNRAGSKLGQEDFARMIIASIAEGNKSGWESKDMVLKLASTFWVESAGGWTNARGDTHLGDGMESNGVCQILYKPTVGWGRVEYRLPENQLNVWQHLDNCYTVYEAAGDSMQPWSAYIHDSWKKHSDSFEPIIKNLLEEYNLDW